MFELSSKTIYCVHMHINSIKLLIFTFLIVVSVSFGRVQ